MPDTNTDPKADAAAKAAADAQAADAKTQAAQAKANDAAKLPEQKAVDKAAADADMAHRKAAEADAATRETPAVTSVGDAKVMAPVDADMDAGHHMAQKFGNDPRNPKMAPGLDDSNEAKTVKLSRVTPDSPSPVTTSVHPTMVGDYLRAGWNVD